MSDVIQFTKRKVKESPEVISFKTDLKMFINYLNKIDTELSIQTSINHSDSTSNSFNAIYMKSQIAAIVNALEKTYTNTYKTLGLINWTIRHAVTRFVAWSYHPTHPLFEFEIVVSMFTFTVTTLMLSADKVVVTCILDQGKRNLNAILQRNLHLLKNARMTFHGADLTGGATVVSCIEKLSKSGNVSTSEFAPVYFRFVFGEDVPTESKITEKMSRVDFIDYLHLIEDPNDYLFLPIGEVCHVDFHHPLLEETVTTFPAITFSTPHVIPLSFMDKETSFTIYTETEMVVFTWSEEDNTWMPGQAIDRPDTENVMFLENYLRNLDMRGLVWSIDTDTKVATFERAITNKDKSFTFTLSRKGIDTAHPIDSIGITNVDLRFFQMQTVAITAAMFSILDANTSLLKTEILDSLTD